MSVYLLGDIHITDESWLKDYGESVHHIVHRHDGKFLTRSTNIECLQGTAVAGTMIAIIEFPNAESAKSFLADPEYAKHSEARSRGSESRVLLIDQSDFVSSIPYLSNE